MQTGHELFVHGLKDMLDAERQLVEALEENANESSRADLKKAFDQHRKETEGQIERREREDRESKVRVQAVQDRR